MAHYQISENRKGLVAKIQVYTKDVNTGKTKIVTKRIYNNQNLTKPKFEKFVTKFALEFEDAIHNQIEIKTSNTKNQVLTFAQLGNEFVENIKANLSINYYLRAKEVTGRFNKYLKQIGLDKEPISSISVRDIQLFLNSFTTYKKSAGETTRLKRELPDNISFRELARQNIIDRSSSYELRRHKKKISKEKALQICKFCNLDFNQYFEEVNGQYNYSVETIKGYRRVLRTIFNEAVRYDWIFKNPVCNTKINSTNGNVSLRPVLEKEVFSFQEAKDFIKALDETEDEDFIYKRIVLKFMLLTGVRLGEMCGLRWSDIDFNKKIVHISRSRHRCAEFGVYEKGPKSVKSERDIPLTDNLINDLISFQKWFRLADDEFDDKLDKYYIAVNVFREPVNKESIGHWLRRFEQKNGFKKASCHGLRHTYCSLLLAQNVPIQTVSKFLGHSDSTITLKVYSHFISDTTETVVGILKILG